MSDDATGMGEERLAEIRACAENYNGLLVQERPNSAIAHRAELLAEVKRLRDLNAELSETLDVRLDETQRLRAKLATRADLMSGLDAEVDRLAGDNAKLRARLAEIGETREEFALRGDGGEAYCATREGALRVAEDWNRIRTDGPWRAEVRVVGQWREVPDA